MFEPTSRYYLINDAEYTAPDGRKINYKLRRFLPQGETLPLYTETAVQPQERLDTLTTRTLGDPLQFWQICDANNCMNPFDMIAESHVTIRVPIPQFPGL